MKKYLLILLLLFPLTVTAQTYQVDEYMKVDMNDNWYTFTRTNLKDNKQLEELNITYDYLNDFMNKNSVYLDALKKESKTEDMIESFVRIKEADINDLSNYDDDFVKEVAKELQKKINASEYDIYKNNYKYAYIKYNDQGLNIIQYYTVVNKKGYNIQFQKQNDFTKEEQEEFQNIISKITYKINKDLKEETNNKNKTYNYTMIGAIAGAIVGTLLVVNKNKKESNEVKIKIKK